MNRAPQATQSSTHRFTRRPLLTRGVGTATSALLAAACGPRQGASLETAPAGQSPVTVTYMGPAASGERLTLETELFQSFNQIRRDVAVEVAAGPGGWNQLREKLIDTGKDQVARYTWPQAIDQMVALYRRLAGS